MACSSCVLKYRCSPEVDPKLLRFLKVFSLVEGPLEGGGRKPGRGLLGVLGRQAGKQAVKPENVPTMWLAVVSCS